MPRRARELGALDIKRAQHPGGSGGQHRIAVGAVHGLQLSISEAGAKCWVLRTLAGGKRREIGLGSYPAVSLADARDKAREAKEKIRAGVDPIEERRAARAAIAAATSRGLTFSAAADRWIEAKGAGMSEGRRRRDRAALARHAEPVIGKMLVADLTPQDIIRTLAPLWAEKHETASNLRQRIEAVLTWATVAGHRAGDNPARWRGNLKELMPDPAKIAAVDHQPAVALADVPGWWAALGACGGMGAQALRFAALTAARSGQVRGATWGEIDLDAALWTIPAARMKARRDHRVPLPSAAVAILRGLPRLAGSAFVFPAPRGGALSDMTISKVMRDMQAREAKAGRPGWLDARSGRPAVPHGLRSTFRDWCAERGIDDNVAELALAHQVGNAVERAYLRSDMIERRRAVMDEWAAFLAGRERGAVIPFPARASGPAA